MDFDEFEEAHGLLPDFEVVCAGIHPIGECPLGDLDHPEGEGNFIPDLQRAIWLSLPWSERLGAWLFAWSQGRLRPRVHTMRGATFQWPFRDEDALWP